MSGLDIRKLIGRIVLLITNIVIIISIVIAILDKFYGALVILIPIAIVSIALQVDELIHPEKYDWD